MDNSENVVIRRGLVLEWIKPDEIHSVWEQIRPGLLKVNNHATGWIVEDVYTAIKTGTSVLHLGYIAGEYAGFIVTSNEKVSHGTIINIWCLYHEQNDFSLFEENIEIVKGWAKNIGAYAIRMSSPRKGWEKQAPKLGFKPIHTVYELDVKESL